MSETMKVTFFVLFMSLFAAYLITDAVFNIKGKSLKQYLKERKHKEK